MTRHTLRLRYGQKKGDVEHALKRMYSEGRVQFNSSAVWSQFTPEQKHEWRSAYGSVAGAESNITSVLWTLARDDEPYGHPIMGKSKGWYAFERPLPSPKSQTVSPASTTQGVPNGISHLRLVGTTVDGDALYLDPTSGVIGTVEFVPYGKAGA